MEFENEQSEESLKLEMSTDDEQIYENQYTSKQQVNCFPHNNCGDEDQNSDPNNCEIIQKSDICRKCRQKSSSLQQLNCVNKYRDVFEEVTSKYQVQHNQNTEKQKTINFETNENIFVNQEKQKTINFETDENIFVNDYLFNYEDCLENQQQQQQQNFDDNIKHKNDCTNTQQKNNFRILLELKNQVRTGENFGEDVTGKFQNGNMQKHCDQSNSFENNENFGINQQFLGQCVQTNRQKNETEEENDLAIALCLQQELNEEYDDPTSLLVQESQQIPNSNNKKLKRRKQSKRSAEKFDDDYDADYFHESEKSFENSHENNFFSDENENENFLVNEDFAGINDFRVNVGIQDNENIRYDRDGMIPIQEEEEQEILTESEIFSDDEDNYDETEIFATNSNFNALLNNQNINNLGQNSNRSQLQKSNVLKVRLSSGNGRVKILRCPTQFSEPKFQEPFFLFEQVASCQGDALKIFIEFLESDLVKIDSYPNFSHARRQRVYATNLRKHKKISDYNVQKRSLKEILNWAENVLFPVWTNSIFKIDPVKTILASNNLLVKKAELELTRNILRNFQQETGPQTELQIKLFFPEEVLKKMQKMCLVPCPEKTLTVLNPEQKEELMGYEIGHTNIFSCHVGSSRDFFANNNNKINVRVSKKQKYNLINANQNENGNPLFGDCSKKSNLQQSNNKYYNQNSNFGSKTFLNKNYNNKNTNQKLLNSSTKPKNNNDSNQIPESFTEKFFKINDFQEFQKNQQENLIENSVCSGCNFGRIKNGRCIIDKKIQQNQLNQNFSTPQKYLDARDRAIGNSFQTDTVAYLLSPLKYYLQQQYIEQQQQQYLNNSQNKQQQQKLKPINVLSLFDGIGGAAVALYKLKIPVRKYYSCEINPFVQKISEKFVLENLRKINPDCEFINLGCIKNVNQQSFLNQLVGEEKIDLLIGGPPCSNLSGANRHQGEAGRSGVTGRNSQLFFVYAEILQYLRNLYSKIS